MTAERELQHRANRAQKVRCRIFNDKGLREQAPKIHRVAKRDALEVEGILEVQKMLFLKLAEQENRVKGFSERSNLERSKDVQSKTDLEQLRADTALAVQATWNKGSKTREKHAITI
ncbi:hypothetical protein IQ07DRAFT_600369 [Pyrenochaeta sp. DS3sAY3a]|nr:hypothetical protein IQ07DRAFT_600369 [Pyrenochaeta sp. DS3sAY3a]